MSRLRPALGPAEGHALPGPAPGPDSPASSAGLWGALVTTMLPFRWEVSRGSASGHAVPRSFAQLYWATIYNIVINVTSFFLSYLGYWKLLKHLSVVLYTLTIQGCPRPEGVEWKRPIKGTGNIP